MSRRSRTKQRSNGPSTKIDERKDAAAIPSPTLDKIETSLRTMRVDAIEWLKFAEAKNAGLFIGTITLVGIIIAYLTAAKNISDALQLSLQVAVVMLVWSTSLTLFSFVPRLNLVKMLQPKRKGPDSSDNLEYYGHVAKYTPEQLIRAINQHYFEEVKYPAVTPKQHLDIAAQIIANARIALYKYRLFSMAIQSVFLSLVSAIITFGIYSYWF